MLLTIRTPSKHSKLIRTGERKRRVQRDDFTEGTHFSLLWLEHL